jgi:hypothetical protein
MKDTTAERKGREEYAKGAKEYFCLSLRPLRVFAPFAFGFWALIVHAQDDASVAAERARLKQAREKAEAQYGAEEKACYGKFAVNDCLAAARAKRREALSDLRRQEIALNDAERKRKAAERQRSIEERNAQREREAASQPQAGDRTLRANERAASRAAQAASAPAKAAEREKQVREKKAQMKASAQRRESDAAKNAKEHEKRVAEAKEREQKMKERQAQRKKPPASSLADPQ